MPAILDKVPFLRFLLPFITGILLQYYLGGKYIYILFIFLSCILFFIYYFFTFPSLRFFRNIFGTGCMSFFLGAGAFVLYITDKATSWSYPENEKFYLVEVKDDPVNKKNTVSCRLKVISLLSEESSFPIKKDVIAYFQGNTSNLQIKPGDKLLIHTSIQIPLADKNPSEFNYPQYLKQQGVSGVTYIKETKWMKLNEKVNFNIKYKALQCRKKLLFMLDALPLDKEEKAILSAITLGYKHDLTPEIKNTFSTTGASHILAVSGLHVGIIFMFTHFLLMGFNRNTFMTRIIKYGVIILILWGFAFITGLSPSVVRATSMFSLSLMAKIVNKRSSTLNTICIAAFCMLLYNPFYLFDISFQLSYSAVISIVSLQPYFQKIVTYKNRVLSFLWSLISVSIAAQAGTLPFILYYFHQFPTYFIFTNIVVIPLTYIILITSSILLLTESFYGNSLFFGEILIYAVKFLTYIIGWIEKIPYSSFREIGISSSDLLFFFLIGISLAFFFIKKRMASLHFSLVFICVLFISKIIMTFESATQSSIVFYYHKDFPVINIMDHYDNYFISAKPDGIPSVMKEQQGKNKSNSPVLLPIHFSNEKIIYQDNYIQYKDKSIYLAKDNKMAGCTLLSPLAVDYLLIASECTMPISELLTCIHPEEIIFDASLPAYVRKKLVKECEEKEINYYDIARQGHLKVSWKK